MTKLKTVKVVADNEHGFMIINECDLGKNQKLYEAKAKPGSESKDSTPTPSPKAKGTAKTSDDNS